MRWTLLALLVLCCCGTEKNDETAEGQPTEPTAVEPKAFPTKPAPGDPTLTPGGAEYLRARLLEIARRAQAPEPEVRLPPPTPEQLAAVDRLTQLRVRAELRGRSGRDPSQEEVAATIREKNRAVAALNAALGARADELQRLRGKRQHAQAERIVHDLIQTHLHGRPPGSGGPVLRPPPAADELRRYFITALNRLGNPEPRGDRR